MPKINRVHFVLLIAKTIVYQITTSFIGEYTTERRTMNELQTSNMKTPIEIALGVDENGMTTAKALYEFLSGEKSNFSKWAKRNIEQNEFYEENKDWWGFVTVTNGNECKDYRLTTDFAKHLSMESHSARGKEARQYFITIEDRAKQEVINRSQLSPQMQMVMQMAESMARQELEQKRQAEHVQKLESTVTNMKEIFTEPIGDWKADINAKYAIFPQRAVSTIRHFTIRCTVNWKTKHIVFYQDFRAIKSSVWKMPATRKQLSKRELQRLRLF